MQDITHLISLIGIVPVIAIEDAADAVDLANALQAGGLPAAEITFRTSAAVDAISRICDTCPEVLVGAGTVLNIEQCERAIEAGAQFIVSPGFDPELVDYCVHRQIQVFPGCTNASDMTRAVNAGLNTVKFFPAELSGGVSLLKALAPVFPSLHFMPTGGINTINLRDYLSFNRVVACGGTWMVKKDLIQEKQWQTIEDICHEAVSSMLDLRLAHIGINCESEDQAASTAKTICAILGRPFRPGNSVSFACSDMGCMKQPDRGQLGHIAFSTENVDRAVYHLSRRGVQFLADSRKLDSDGSTKAIYLDGEICGFAIHLIQK